MAFHGDSILRQYIIRFSVALQRGCAGLLRTLHENTGLNEIFSTPVRYRACRTVADERLRRRPGFPSAGAAAGLQLYGDAAGNDRGDTGRAGGRSTAFRERCRHPCRMVDPVPLPGPE